MSKTLREVCKDAVRKVVQYKGTNGNEYDKANHGKPVQGKGYCTAYHDSHGLCIMVTHDDGTSLCVDPIEVTILK